MAQALLSEQQCCWWRCKPCVLQQDGDLPSVQPCFGKQFCCCFRSDNTGEPKLQGAWMQPLSPAWSVPTSTHSMEGYSLPVCFPAGSISSLLTVRASKAKIECFTHVVAHWSDSYIWCSRGCLHHFEAVIGSLLVIASQYIVTEICCAALANFYTIIMVWGMILDEKCSEAWHFWLKREKVLKRENDSRKERKKKKKPKLCFKKIFWISSSLERKDNLKSQRSLWDPIEVRFFFLDGSSRTWRSQPELTAGSFQSIPALGTASSFQPSEHKASSK